MQQDIHPKDFIETADGLVFAVVDYGQEQGRILSFLRYVFRQGRWRKLKTIEANSLLQQAYPHYLYFSQQRDAHLHAVPLTAIHKHHRPRERTQQLLETPATDDIHAKFIELIGYLKTEGLSISSLGVTGSLLIGAQTPRSDIDLVIYGREAFQYARTALGRLIEQGDLNALDCDMWRESYQRRGCSLSFEEYLWHERRKLNKVAIAGTKVDLGLLPEPSHLSGKRFQKRKSVTLQARVIDDRFVFDYPARYPVQHSAVSEVVSYIATYTGQAFRNEVIQAVGYLESTDPNPDTGKQQLVVGSDREALGEYIKVIQLDQARCR